MTTSKDVSASDRMISSIIERDINRELIISFEQECIQRVSSLASVQSDLDRLKATRRQCVEEGSNIDHSEVVNFMSQLDILRKRIEIISTSLHLDEARLQSSNHSQTLSHLIESTSPYSYQDRSDSAYEAHKLRAVDTETQRNALIQKNLKRTKEALTHSLHYRLKLSNDAKELQLTLDRLKVEYKANYENAVHRIEAKLQAFLKAASLKESKIAERNRLIMSEYLILRHNSRVAQERLTKRKNDSETERGRMQEQFDEFLAKIAHERDRADSSSREELQLIINESRKHLLNRESQLEEEERRISEKEVKVKTDLRSLREELRAVNRKYDDLQQKRVHELRDMNEDVKKLREMITKVEGNLLRNIM